MDTQTQDNVTTNTVYKLQLNMKMKAGPRGKWHDFHRHNDRSRSVEEQCSEMKRLRYAHTKADPQRRLKSGTSTFGVAVTTEKEEPPVWWKLNFYVVELLTVKPLLLLIILSLHFWEIQSSRILPFGDVRAHCLCCSTLAVLWSL